MKCLVLLPDAYIIPKGGGAVMEKLRTFCEENVNDSLGNCGGETTKPPGRRPRRFCVLFEREKREREDFNESLFTSS